MLQVHRSLEEVTEKGREEEGGLSVGVQLPLQELVKSLREWGLHLQQEVAVLLWDVVVEQHWYPLPLELLFALLLSLMCALLHSPTEDKAADRLQAQTSSAVKIRIRTVTGINKYSWI
jgi:hypothetical protein